MDSLDFKYKTSFSSVVKPIIPSEKDKYIALASLTDISKFIPSIDTERNIDLLPAAFNACLINRANKNGDVIDTATALDIAKFFINKPINIEHNRQHIIGVILSAGFSEFGTDAQLTEEQVATMTTPFNMTLGGVLWKVVNPQITDKIEESNDAASDYFQCISASWELGFSEYQIVVSSVDSKNLSDCEIISPEQAGALENYLKANGGTGKSKNGQCVYRKVIGKVVPLGIGLTENPAAEVKGIAVNINDPSKDVIIKDPSEAENTEKISQSTETVVITNSKKIMKINSLEEITEANWKEISASSVTEFIAESLKTANESFLVEKTKVDDALAASTANNAKLQEEFTGIKSALESVQAELNKLQEEKANRVKVDRFNNRMNALHSQYAMNEELAKVVAEQVKDLPCDNDEDDQNFAKYKSNMAVLLKPYERQVKADAIHTPTKESPETKMKNPKDEAAYAPIPATAKEISASVVDKAIDNAKKETISLPNSIETKKPTLVEKFSQAFSLEEGFIVSTNRR